MSSNSFIVDLRKSMIIANPQHFPMNMEKTAKEDSPVESYPIICYDAKNVIPTAFGYKSFFEESTRINIGNLAGKFVQEIFTYQTADMDNVQFALCEDGIYVAFATTPAGIPWSRIVDLSATVVAGVRKLWTVAVIANVVYLYQAGQPKFWAIVDLAKYAQAATPSLIAGATRSQVWTGFGLGLISYIPSFLNMAGQIGLFRADNRLGFWDSDGSVGWSSSVAIEDFKPDAKTFAGSTKFADVQGRIVKIIGSGDNFVIYATRSIVLCVGLDGSPEKWRGQAIMSEVGVSFDTQVVAAQPDQIHYCITQAGLCSITSGTPEYLATEVMDYIAETFPLYSLSLVEGRYLFISVNGTFPGSEYGTESVELVDYENNKFVFPRPTYPQLEDLKDYLEEALAGRNGETQDSFKDFDPIVDLDTIPPAQPLQPCYDIIRFKSTWAETTFAPIPEGTELLDSKITTGVTYLLEDLYKFPTVTNNSIEGFNILPGNFAGQDAADKLNLAMTEVNKQLAYQEAWKTANEAPSTVYEQTDWPPPPDWDGTVITIPWEKKLIERRILPNCISVADAKVVSNECRTHLFFDKDRLMETLVYFEGTETYRGASVIFFGEGEKSAAKEAGWADAPECTMPKLYFKAPYTPALFNEFKARYLELVGSPYPYTLLTVNNDLAQFEYFRWCYRHYTSQCSYTVLSEMQLEAIFANGLARATYESSDMKYDDMCGEAQWAHYWYETVDSSPYTARPGRPDYTDDEGSGFGFGPYGVGSGGPSWWGSNFIFNTTAPKPLDLKWSTEQKDAIKTVIATGGYILEGTITRTLDLLPNFPAEFTVYDMELTGWGYTPSGGFSFRKTHNRNSSTSCGIPGSSQSVNIPETITTVTLPPLDRPSSDNPPYVWEYPDSIPLPPNYALFQKGSLGSYYPTYGSAAVYDLLLQKWGVYNNSHKLIQELMPVNRVDSSIMPVSDKGMFAGALNPAHECTIFKDLNPGSRVTYGKMAFYRRGMSLASGAIAHFGALATGTLIVEASMDGVTVDPTLSYAVPFVNQRNVTLDFTTRAKWFNIRVEGNFNLTYLELLAEGRGRR